MSEIKKQKQITEKNENRTLKNFRFTQNTIQRIEQVAKEFSYTQTAAVEFMIRKYFENRTKEFNATKSLLLDLKADTKKIRTISNNIDYNVQKQLGFWIDYMEQNGSNHSTVVQKYSEEEFQKAFQFGIYQFFKYLNAKKGEN